MLLDGKISTVDTRLSLNGNPILPEMLPPLGLGDSLKAQGADDIIVFVGGVIPAQDYDFLYEAGVKGVYGPGTPIPASAKDVLEQIRKAVAA